MEQSSTGGVEIAIFKTKEGVTREQLLGTVDAVSEWAARQPGFISRDLAYSAESDRWIDVLWWESLEAAHVAIDVAMTAPECAPMFAALDEGSIRMLHAKRVTEPVSTDKTGSVLELALFKVNAGVSGEKLQSTVDAVSQWAVSQPGFVSRDLTYAADSDTWIDVIWWESMEAAGTAMEASYSSEACAPMFAVIDMDAGEMLHAERVIAGVVAQRESVDA